MKHTIILSLLLFLTACTMTTVSDIYGDMPRISLEGCNDFQGTSINLNQRSTCPEQYLASYEITDVRAPTICCIPTPEEKVEEPTPMQEDNNTPTNEADEPGMNDDGYDAWAAYKVKSGATILVSDGRKAARTYLEQGVTLELATNPPINITLGAMSEDGKVYVTVNDENSFMQEGEDETFLDGSIIVHLDDVITT